MKKRLLYLNPASSHGVFKGRRYFFNKFYDFHIFNHTNETDFGVHHSLIYKKLIRLGKNFIVFYNKPSLGIKETDTLIIGDIFTNTLCYLIKRKHKIYYSEFFDYKKSTWKKMFFWTIGLLFFHNKKFILPTHLAQQTFTKITNKIFYLPQIYYGDIFEAPRKDNNIIKLLFVGRISNIYKNIDFMINNYLAVKEKNPNIELTLVGEIHDSDFYEKHQKHIDNGNIIYIGPKKGVELDTIYTDHDVFILASDSDPIGSVIQEAMAHSCAILVSDTTGASCYIKNGNNGYIFKTNDNKDYQKKLTKIIENPSFLERMKKKSLAIIKQEYRYENTEKLEEYRHQLETFINK